MVLAVVVGVVAYVLVHDEEEKGSAAPRDLRRPVALSPDGRRLYVGIPGGVVVVDTRERTRLKIVPLDGAIDDLVVSRDGSEVYVGWESGVAVIRPATEEIPVHLVDGPQPEPVRLVQDAPRKRLYALVGTRIRVFDADTGTEPVDYPVGQQQAALEVAPDGTRLYLADPAGQVTAMDTGSGRTSPLRRVAGRPLDLVVSPDGSRLLVGTDTGPLAVLVIADGRTEPSPVTAAVNALRVTDKGLLRASLHREGQVRVDEQVVAVRDPAGIADGGDTIYVTSYSEDRVTLLDAATGATKGTIRLTEG